MNKFDHISDPSLKEILENGPDGCPERADYVIESALEAYRRDSEGEELLSEGSSEAREVAIKNINRFWDGSDEGAAIAFSHARNFWKN